MSAGRVAALAITTVGLLATTASAQGLGAAAARAAEARTTTGTQPAVKLTDADLPKASVLEAEALEFHHQHPRSSPLRVRAWMYRQRAVPDAAG